LTLNYLFKNEKSATWIFQATDADLAYAGGTAWTCLDPLIAPREEPPGRRRIRRRQSADITPHRDRVTSPDFMVRGTTIQVLPKILVQLFLRQPDQNSQIHALSSKRTKRVLRLQYHKLFKKQQEPWCPGGLGYHVARYFSVLEKHRKVFRASQAQKAVFVPRGRLGHE
jgi:hypothetical protein